MTTSRFFSAALVIVPLLVACSSDPATGDAGTSDASTATDGAASPDAATSDASTVTDAGADVAYVEPACPLRNDTGGPGQYSDSCVRREWIAPYAGTYTSAACELTIAAEGPVAATFSIKVLGGASAGNHVVAWEGGAAGIGNDSYYRFTTDATFATTKTLSFNAGQQVGASDERNVALRVENIDTGTATYTGRFADVVGGKAEEVDCGALTKR